MNAFVVLFAIGFALLALGGAQDWHIAIALGGYFSGLAFARLSHAPSTGRVES